MSGKIQKQIPLGAPLWLLGGVLALTLAWLLPYNLGSLTVSVLRSAGENTSSVARLGLDYVRSEKSGPAALLLQAAESLGSPEAPLLTQELQQLTRSQGGLAAWGGWDPFIDPVFKPRKEDAAQAHTPVIQQCITSQARKDLRSYLSNSRSQGVLTLLALREAEHTGRFVPANRPGGQVLDSLELLAAFLYQGEHLSPALQRELRSLAEQTVATGDLQALEPVFADLLSLAKRLDWTQLCELLRRTEDTKTLGEYAQLARVASEDFALIYAAALFSSADRVAAYLMEYGKAGLEDLRLAMSLDQGAARLLLERHLPINRAAGRDLGALATLGLLHPHIALGMRWLCFFLGAFAMLRGVDRLFIRDQAGFGPALPHLKAGALAVLLAGLLAISTEPFLLKAAPISEFKARLSLPVLATLAPELPDSPSNHTSMDTTTLLSIGFFAALQIAMYLICLAKIREIDRKALSPLVKLELMQNEENLFDGGLYIGIGGTATALVLQVLQIIEPNLLAAYSSNLFGITCVALVKIRHVRPYKTALILAGQQSVPANTPSPAPKA